MSDQFPNIGAMPPRGGHAPSLSAGAASAQAGMTRIQRGSEVRYVWPVHLPGWLAVGWQVGSGEGGTAAAMVAPVVVTPDRQAPHPAAASAPRFTTGSGRPRPLAPSPSALQPVPATTNPGVADTDSSRQDDADLTAHLPTNLLDLDEEEPTGEQASPAGNDAVSAWNPDLDAVDLPAEAAESAAESSATEPVEAAALAEVAVPALDVTEVTEPPAAAVTGAPQDPAPQPAPARRGRPRKVRPEAQAEPAAATASQGPAPAPAAQDPAPASASEGDDPFGLDPLL